MSTFTHTPIPPRVPTAYQNQRWFHGGDATSEVRSVDQQAYADVYRDGTKDAAEVRLECMTAGCIFRAHAAFDAASLRRLAQRLLDAACDIEANPAKEDRS